MREAGVDLHPVAMNWVITNQCPLRCVHCLNGFHAPDPKELDTKKRASIIESAFAMGVRRLSIMGGEPFIVPELDLLVEYARRHDIDVNITTSGIVRHREMLERMAPGVEYLNISIDGPQELNDEYRGAGVHAKAMEFTRLAQDVGIPIRIYTVLSWANSTAEMADSISQQLLELKPQTVIFISFSPIGEGMGMDGLRLPLDEFDAQFDGFRQRLKPEGIEVKRADPYEPESQKVFIDPYGGLYIPKGRHPRQMIGDLLGPPALDLQRSMGKNMARQHMTEYHDRQVRPRAHEVGRDTPPGMVWIGPATYQMGGGVNDRDRLAHPVYTDGFYIDIYQVTNQRYAEFLNSAGSGANVDSWIELDKPECQIRLVDCKYQPVKGREGYPAVCVTWSGADAFASWAGGRLPTEAEWEKAARGGLDRAAFPWGDQLPKDQCNWRDYTGPYASKRVEFYKDRGPAPVGLFPANEVGLHDIAGNVWEWCSDWLDLDAYTPGLRVNPAGPDEGRYKVARGGAYSFDPVNLRCSQRSYARPESGYPWTGFRTVVDVESWIRRVWK